MSKRYIIIAGVNGAGKSTFYASKANMFTNVEKINVDDVIRQTGDWHNPSDVIAAGKIVVSKISSCLDKGIFFC